MKLEVENRKKVIWLAVLAAIALVMLGYEFWPDNIRTGQARHTAHGFRKSGAGG